MPGCTRRGAAAAALGLAAVLAGGGVALGEPAAFDYSSLPVFEDPLPVVVTYPKRLVAPDYAALWRVYPKAAKKAQLNGRVALECKVNLAGQLTRCVVPYEIPEGYGFGQAALALAPLFQMLPGTVDGVPTEGRPVTQPMVFTGFPENPRPEAPPPPLRFAPPGSHLPAPPELETIVLPQGRLAVLGVTRSGAMSFASLAEPVRGDGTVEVDWLVVTPHAREWTTLFSVSRFRVDCAAHSREWLGMRQFDEAGEPDGWNLPNDSDPTPPKPDTPLGHVIALACGETPAAVVTGTSEALALARGWPDGGQPPEPAGRLPRLTPNPSSRIHPRSP